MSNEKVETEYFVTVDFELLPSVGPLAIVPIVETALNVHEVHGHAKGSALNVVAWRAGSIWSATVRWRGDRAPLNELRANLREQLEPKTKSVHINIQRVL